MKEFTTKITIDFDFVDRIKILFGLKPVVHIQTLLPIEVGSYNITSKVGFDSKTKHQVEKPLPDFGLTAPYQVQ